MKMEHRELGRFGHHPNPAIDFCVEVEVIEGETYDVMVGNSGREVLERRIVAAMDFCVGGDEIAINAKHTLRQCAAKLKDLASPPHSEAGKGTMNTDTRQMLADVSAERDHLRARVAELEQLHYANERNAKLVEVVKKAFDALTINEVTRTEEAFLRAARRAAVDILRDALQEVTAE